MGEYAKLGKAEIKIGTCEDMYYLRAGQAQLVTALSGNVDPVRDREALRFRFPFPDEDGTQPGAFDRFERGVGLYGVEAPADIEHLSIQFQAPGYNVCLPCPEAAEAKAIGLNLGITIHRNGHPGPVQIRQQKWVGDQLVLVAACGGCGSLWRLPTLEDAQPYIAACLKNAEGESSDSPTAKWWHEIARRIEAGYKGETA